MNTMIATAALCTLTVFSSIPPLQAQEKDKAAITRQLVETQRYIFIPQSAMPLSGRVRQLSFDYSLKITKDTIDCYLPYFGRAYSAPIDATQGGIQFVTSSFEYTATPRKKSGWDITLKPKDNRDVQQMQLSVSETGYASLQVISNNRQAISYNGYITEIKERKKK